MTLSSRLALLLCLLSLFAIPARAQKSELSLLVGRLEPSDRTISTSSAISAALGGSVAYQVSYARRVLDGQIASLNWEMVIAGAPRSNVKSTSLLLPRNYSSLFFTPGLKLRLLPGAGFSPYIAAGIGAGRFAQDSTLLNNRPNNGDLHNTTWAFNYGGGIDLSLIGPVGLRAEIRDYLTGNPDLQARLIGNRQHNIFAGIGVVVKW